jgi:hypothetical protein
MSLVLTPLVTVVIWFLMMAEEETPVAMSTKQHAET